MNKNLLITLFCFTTQFMWANDFRWNLEMPADSIELYLPQIKKETLNSKNQHYYEALYLLALRHTFNDKQDSALVLFEKIVTSSNPKPSLPTYSYTCLYLGMLNKNYNRNFNLANDYFQKAYDGFIKINHPKGINSALQFMAFMKMDEFENIEALKLFLKAEKVLATYHDPNHLLYFYFNIYELLLKLGLNDEAKEYLNKGIDLIDTSGGSIPEKSKLVFNVMLGEFYSKANDLAKTRHYFKEAFKYCKTFSDSMEVELPYIELYYKLKKYDTTLLKCESLIQKTSFDRKIYATTFTKCYAIEAKIFLERGEIDKSLEYATKAYTNYNEYLKELPIIERDLNMLLSTLYKLKGNFREASGYSSKYEALLEREISNQATLITQMYEYEKESMANHAEIITLESKVRQSEIIRNTIIIGSIILSALLILLWRQFSSKRRALELLHENMDELKRTQNQLVAQEKMASLGILAAGIAHEINNPLNFIFQSVIEIEKHVTELSKPNELKPFFGAIHTGTMKLKELTNSLSLYVRNVNSPHVTCSINSIIKNCITILGDAIRLKVEISITLKENLPDIHANESQLHQVFINIINNAVQSINEYGKISITTEHNDPFIVVTITDTGEGIQPQHLKKIFDPFYTTKPPGKGVGLGLSIANKIIQEHHGKFTVQSEPDIGTTFIIQLPIQYKK